jgi:hypothetical protein
MDETVAGRIQILLANKYGIEPFGLLPVELIRVIFKFQYTPAWLPETFTRPLLMSLDPDPHTLCVGGSGNFPSIVFNFLNRFQI